MPGVRVHCAPGGLVELVQNNPLPSIHGRVCYHPCETVCNRALTDSAVSIHAVERFLGDLANGLMQQKLATASGYWPLIRYNPALRAAGKKPFVLDSPRPSIPPITKCATGFLLRLIRKTPRN